MIREWLSAMLRGDTPECPFPDKLTHESIFDLANAEGIVGLLNERIRAAGQSSDIPPELSTELARSARIKAQQSLMRESECRRILSCLSDERIDVLLLKGSALAYWLYPSAHLRECSDIDLLFCSYADAQKAVGILQTLQYSLLDPALAGTLVSFEQTCVRNSNDNASGLEIDLHWQLSSSPVFAYRFGFDELNASAIALPKLGSHARGLSLMHAFFNACMHRIQNMTDGTENTLKWLYDLHLLSLEFTHADWQSLCETAIQRKLAGTCLAGLRATQLEFNTVVPANVFDALENAAKHEHLDVNKMHRWLYIQRMSFFAFPSTQMSMRWLLQRLLPNTAYLQARYGGSNNFFSLALRRIRAGFQRLF
ncbi:MAG: nucleotidyltransferase family protein [Arenimonas sp.]